jgi:Ca2+-transporting ATPase
VCAVGNNSCEGRLKEITQLDSDLTPLQKKLNKVANDISKVGAVCAAIAVVVLFIRMGLDLGLEIKTWSTNYGSSTITYNFLVGITVLIVAIPEGLPLAVTISLAYSVLKM